MTGLMKYRNFFATVEADVEVGILVGRLQGISDVVSFHATDFADLKQAFRTAVDDYIETCRKVGKEPQRPASGKLMLRIDPEIHKLALQAAAEEGLTLNKWGESVLRSAVAETLSTPEKVAKRRKSLGRTGRRTVSAG